MSASELVPMGPEPVVGPNDIASLGKAILTDARNLVAQGATADYGRVMLLRGTLAALRQAQTIHTSAKRSYEESERHRARMQNERATLRQKKAALAQKVALTRLAISRELLMVETRKRAKLASALVRQKVRTETKRRELLETQTRLAIEAHDARYVVLPDEPDTATGAAEAPVHQEAPQTGPKAVEAYLARRGAESLSAKPGEIGPGDERGAIETPDLPGDGAVDGGE